MRTIRLLYYYFFHTILGLRKNIRLIVERHFMLAMFLYGISIMYTPGPVTLVCINQGLNKRFKNSIGFFIGVGVAMFALLLIFGYTGEKLIKPQYLIYISLIGGLYIIYLAYKVYQSKIDIDSATSERNLSFKDGFLMQFFNPKAILAALPLATINYPANHITGFGIFWTSFIFMFIVIGSPTLYCLLGQFFSRIIKSGKVLSIFNKIMAVVLLYVAFTILYDHVYLVLTGVNAY
jgi:cysteine/O-acetylserine efflux protein